MVRACGTGIQYDSIVFSMISFSLTSEPAESCPMWLGPESPTGTRCCMRDNADAIWCAHARTPRMRLKNIVRQTCDRQGG